MSPDDLIQAYTSLFDRKPTAFVEAPGRVNLIGEHTDYNGYPVLPMAIRRAIRVAVAPRDDIRVVVHAAEDRFKPCAFDVSDEIPRSEAGDWSNYVKAAVQKLVTELPDGTSLRGFDAMVSGDVPSGAGLSSSSALVVASALAFLAANERLDAFDRAKLSDLMAEAEQYVGTAGGGMDQTVCLQAQEGSALRIDFFPLRTEPVPLPSGVSIVVANSLVVAEKSGAALLKYNQRPIECRLAGKIIGAWYGMDPDEIQRLAQADPPFEVWTQFRETPYSRDEIAGELGIRIDELDRLYLTMNDGRVFPEPEGGFLLHDRVRHVLSEADRVERATEVLRDGDVEAFGQLMNESHASCRDDYGISTPELDSLVDIMREAGALGARLTGAGFGGCAIALVRSEDAKRVIAAVRDRYYRDERGLGDDPPEGYTEWSDVVFATDAGPGATVRNL